MDGGHRYQMGAVLSVEVIQIGAVLEIVGVQVSLFQGGVGQHIVGELHHFQVVALGGQLVFNRVEDLRVGGDGRAYLDGDQLRRSLLLGSLLGGGFGGLSGGLRGGLFRRGLRRFAGAADGAQGQDQSQGDDKQLFHGYVPPKKIYWIRFLSQTPQGRLYPVL